MQQIPAQDDFPFHTVCAELDHEDYGAARVTVVDGYGLTRKLIPKPGDVWLQSTLATAVPPGL